MIASSTLTATESYIASPSASSPDALVLQATLDSLSTHIAILDEKGIILAVNAAWRRFAQNNGFSGAGAGLGANYLDVCTRATGQNAEEAPQVLRGIQEVLQGQKEEFYLEYPCHSPVEARWFALRATRFWSGAGDENHRKMPVRVVVSHESITARKLAEIQLREESKLIETLYRVSQIVAGELHLPRIVEAVTQAAVELSSAQLSAFLPAVDKTPLASQAIYVRSSGHSEPRRSFEELPRLLRESFWQARRPVRIDDASRDFRQAKEIVKWPFEAADPAAYPTLTSCLIAPVMSRSGQRLGALLLGHEMPGRFHSRDEQLLLSLASQAAVALENALLVESARHEKEAASTSESRYRFVTESIPQLVWSTRADGYHEFFNQQWFDYTGINPETSMGEGWAVSIHPDDIERTRARWQQSVQSGERYEIEYRLRRYDGTYHWFLGRALPQRDKNGAILRWFGTCTDIEDQKRAQWEKAAALEREAAARCDAEAANRIKDEFLAVVSHELRTPLTPILGWTNLLKAEGEDPILRRQGIETIERNARAQAQIINDLLDVSRIITGKLKLDVRPVALQSVIEAAIETVEPAAQARSVEIVANYEEAGQIMGDSDRLQQVMWNLLANAIKFTPRQGRVEVRLRRVDSMMEVAVRDSGQGIEPAFLPLVFERFRQADASSTRAHGGLGLGLSIVRHLVEQHGGEVAVASAGKGQGSTFTIRLPIAPVLPEELGDLVEEPAREAAFSVPPEALKGVDVLIVDDEIDARDVLQKTLERSGARVRTASSAKEAFTLFQEQTPDVLLSDIGMPEDDGYTLIQWVRALKPSQGSRVPALTLTAYARAEDRARALRSGYQNHIAKPVAPAELVVTLAALLGRPTEKQPVKEASSPQ